MDEIIPLTWYLESPIDYEHKQYILLSYLQKVDSSFLNKHLSPHYLHLEKMLDEFELFNSSYNIMRKNFDKQRYIIINENPKLIGEENILIDEIKLIIEFSIPQIKNRITLGDDILKRNKQILY